MTEGNESDGEVKVAAPVTSTTGSTKKKDE